MFISHKTFLVLLALAIGANAEVIGVDLLGHMKYQKPQKDEASDGLFDPVMRLNRFTFENTVLSEHDDTGALYSGMIQNWVVLFCPPWYEPCQALDPIFRSLTTEWEEKLNSELFVTEVRFGAVDCATEKTLCNQQNVDTYPFVGVYRRHKQVGRWRGESLQTLESELRNFLRQMLGNLKERKAREDAMASSAKGLPLSEYFLRFTAWLDAVTTGHGMLSLRQVFALLVFAGIAFKALSSSFENARGEASPASFSDKPPTQDGVAVSGGGRVAGVERSTCVTRSLPKVWAAERASIEL